MSIWTTRKLAALAATAFLLALGAYLAFGVFGVQAAFMDDEVNEEFVVSSETSETSEAPETTEMMSGESEEAAASGEESVMEESVMEEEASSGPELVSSGEFQAVEHAGEGTANVYRLEDGSHTLRLEGLNVDNGPDLYLYAVADDSAEDSASVEEAGFINLGRLKGNVGDQTYPLPADFDPEEHEAISVWCQRFSVNFTAASLESSS